MGSESLTSFAFGFHDKAWDYHQGTFSLVLGNESIIIGLSVIQYSCPTRISGRISEDMIWSKTSKLLKPRQGQWTPLI